MGKQVNNSGGRLYDRAKRIQAMCQWMANAHLPGEMQDLIWEARFAADQASRLSVVQANLKANGLWVRLPVAECEERVNELEIRLSKVLSNWILPASQKEQPKVRERQTVRVHHSATHTEVVPFCMCEECRNTGSDERMVRVVLDEV